MGQLQYVGYFNLHRPMKKIQSWEGGLMMENTTLACVLLAPGQSKRFKGERKLTAPFHAKPLVQHVLMRCHRSYFHNVL